MAGPVVVTVVKDEMEAQLACGLLRANGIKCGAIMGDSGAGPTAVAPETGVFGRDVLTAGPVEIVVDEKDLDAAKALLARPPGDDGS